MKSSIRNILLITVFFTSLLNLNAQIFPFWRYTTADELASSTVNDIFQDSKGYIWFATDRGVSRFDGFKFNNYLYAEGLPSPRISSFAKNSEGKVIAAAPFAGVEVFGNNFKEILPASDLTPNDECVDHEQVFFSLKKGDYISITTKSSRITKKLQLNAIPFAIQYKEDGIIVATDEGLCNINMQGAIQFDPLITKPIYSIYISNTAIYASGDSEIYIKNPSGDMQTIAIPGSGIINNLLVSTKADYWFTSPDNRTLYQYRPGNKILNASEEMEIEGTQINGLFEDHEGNIWIATTGKGTLCVHHFFTTNYTKSEGLENDYITSLTLNNDDILIIGTMDGIYELKNEEIRRVEGSVGIKVAQMSWNAGAHYIFSTAPNTSKKTSSLFKILAHIPKIEMLNEDQLNGVLQLMHNSKNKFDQYERKYRDEADSLTILAAINDIYVDENQVIWIGTKTGLITSEKIITDTAFLDVNISCIVAAQNNDIYFGTDNGIAKLSNGKWKFFKTIDEKNVESVTSITFDRKNRLWIGTLTGLSVWDHNKLIQFDTKNILLSDEINALVFDENKNCIWAGTSSGLSCIHISNFDASVAYAPLPLFKNLRTEDSVYRELDLKKEINLPYNSRNFALRFSAIHFATPEGVKFFYKYDDADWQPATGRQIEFASIPYGKHIFQLKAIGERDLEGGPAVLVVNVQTPFWATPWFKIVLGVIFVFLAYLSIRKRFEVIKKKQQERLELQAKIAELRHQALAASMNPHFIFNALNSIQQFINVHDTEEASEFLGKFARLIRIMLNSGGKTFITLKDELERLNYYLELEKVRFGNKLNFEIDVDENLETEKTEIPNMVIQPIVENALWHGLLPANRDGCLKIAFSKMNGSIHVLVDDNGIGVNESRKKKKSGHVSLGLQMIKERLLLLNRLNGYKGSIAVTDKIDLKPAQQGTRVDIVLS